VNGFVVKEASPYPSSWRARISLDDYLKSHGIVGIQGIDTRALTRHLRDHGAQDGLISSVDLDDERLRAAVRHVPGLVGRDLVREVTSDTAFAWSEGPWDLTRGCRPGPAGNHASRSSPTTRASSTTSCASW
jgi:carbamoyl-phosphate synthase small subunit